MAIEILDKGACKAAGVIDTLSPVGACRAQGIRSVQSLLPGKLQLSLVEGIGQTEFVWEATCEVPSVGAGITANCVWIDPFTIELQTYNEAGLLAPARVSFFFFLIEGLGTPAIVAPPLPDPLAIMGADLIGWWRADSIVQSAGKVSQANDLSGNARHLVQATAANQPGISPAGGPNHTPAFVFDGTGTTTGTAKQLDFAGAFGLGIGDFPALFVVQKMTLAQAANLCVILGIRDTANAPFNQILLERRDTVPPGHFGGNVALAGGVGGFDGPIVLDQSPHLIAALLDPLAGFVSVDGVLGAPKVTTGGLLTAPNLISIGGSPTFVGNSAFGGLIMDAWITKLKPSALQLAALNAYVRNLYGIPIP